ncbi:MAG: cell division protease FtsH [Chlamydiales bacterium]|jgi:cell division protease FtsH
MANDEQENQDFKKGLPNSFLLFLLAALFVVFMVQNLAGGRFAKVSFSHQLEHLVNLNLIQPEDSRKIALNDNLVTFSGKFREKESEEGKKRYKYLELLHRRHFLERESASISDDLDTLGKRSREAADWYLHLRGIPLPKEGYRVVETVYDTPERANHLIIKKLSETELVSFPEVNSQHGMLLKGGGSTEEWVDYNNEVSALVENLRSPILGIGNESMKQSLRDYTRLLTSEDFSSAPKVELQKSYQTILGGLNSLIKDLDKAKNYIRLGDLRSVRNYREKLDEYHDVFSKLEQVYSQHGKAMAAVDEVVWFFNNQELSTRTLEKQDPESFTHWYLSGKEEWDSFDLNKGAVFKAPDQPRNLVLEKTFRSEEPATNYLNYLFTVLPVILVVLLIYFVFSRQMKGMGTGAMNFGKSPAKLMSKDDNKITFKDVAGIDEATEELVEIVDFLKNPEKFTSLGGRIPKGVLCIGPPGTGKTLIAKAVAGEADRPFFTISGSDFVEMFVGVGASRIRDMFDTAKKNAPCIIFMDEIDAVGRHRGAGIGGGHDEREQTLNQLLVEMDGFDSKDGVILMAATNRPDVLDKALLRPGRFDRRIILDLPDIKGRYEILKLHARKIKMDETVDLMALARSTPGSSGADLANLLNEAALLAARRDRRAVTTSEVFEARDKVRYGKERRSLEIDEEEKKSTAYHEAGHAVVGMLVEHADPLEKVTIIPRGFSLGATHYLPKKNRTTYWKKEIIDQIAVLMGGRCAEEIYVKDISSGAQNDIERATGLARSMVCEWGMNEKMGPMAYEEREKSGQYLGMSGTVKKFSEATSESIDKEVQKLLEGQNQRAKDLLLEHGDKVELMTDMLMEFETIDREDVDHIMAGTWDIEEKRNRLKEQEALHKKSLPPPPPVEEDQKADANSDDDSDIQKNGAPLSPEKDENLEDSKT